MFLSIGAYSYAPAALNAGHAAIAIPAGSLPLGTEALTVTHWPDAAGASTYNNALGLATITVTTLPPSFSISGSSVTLVARAASGNTSTVAITPSGGFTGSVTLTRQATAAPANAQCAPTVLIGATSPVTLTNNNAVTATLTIETTTRTSSTMDPPERSTGRRYATGGAALACVTIFGVPVGRRRWRGLLGMAVLLMALGTGIAGCTRGNASNYTAFSGAGMTSGNYTITVTGTSGATVATGAISFMVE